MTKKAESPAVQNATGVTAPAAQPSWLIEKVNKLTGEVKTVSKYRYLDGYPREIRFDAKNGGFTNAGITRLGDELIMYPIAWRLFTDEILGMKRRDWAEIFYVDEDNNVCSVLFHDYSVKNLEEALPTLHYTDRNLNEVKVRVFATEHVAEKVTGKPKYFLANFEFIEIPEDQEDQVKERYDYSLTQRLYRRSTVTPHAEDKLVFNYFNPYHAEQGNAQDAE